MNGKLYAVLASLVQARANCAESHNEEWFVRHTERALKLVSEYMPSGSGIDNGTKLDIDISGPNKLVFLTSYHHMNDCGYYDGWTEHTVIVTPSLQHGFEVRITGRDRNDTKEYLHDVFCEALDTDCDMWAGTPDTATPAAPRSAEGSVA